MLNAMQGNDPQAYTIGVLGELQERLSTLLDPEAVAAFIASDRLELPHPVAAIDYEAFADPNGGRRDVFTLAIGHRDGKRSLPDLLRAWPPAFNPTGVVGEISDLLRGYPLYRVTGDRYAAECPRGQFRARHILYQTAEKQTSDLYLELVSSSNAGRVALPDDPPPLLRELRGLEQRTRPSGRDRVDHAPGAHDDRANAVAGVAWELLRKEPFKYEGIRF
jgi:hypothetical protein